MNMADVREVVGCWLEERVERVERDSEPVTNSYEAFGDFIKWRKENEEWEIVERHQWDSAMEQRGFEQKYEGGERVIPGIKLKDE